MHEQGDQPESSDRVVAALASVDLFATLGEEARREVAAVSRIVSVRAGEVVVRRGDVGDAVFVVRSGLLEVLEGDDAEPVRRLRSGAPFGELALLSGEPRTATVRAVRDSELWSVPKSAFDILLASDADFARAVVRALTRLVFESRAVDDRQTATRLVLAVLALHSDTAMAAVIDAVRATLGADCVWVCSRPDGVGPSGWATMVEDLEREHPFVVLVAGPERDAWFEFCEREADRVILIARPGTEIEPLASATRADLVLLGSGAGGAVAAMLRKVSPRAHHHANAAGFGGRTVAGGAAGHRPIGGSRAVGRRGARLGPHRRVAGARRRGHHD